MVPETAPSHAVAAPAARLLGTTTRVVQDRKTLATGIAGIAFTLLLAQLLPGVNTSSAVIAAILCVCAVMVAHSERAEDRLTSLNLFVCALFVRVLAATACSFLAAREGGPFLGPDSTTYFAMSNALAASALQLDSHPVVHFGSYDVAHYYLFAACIRFFDADLFGLQVMNCGLAALAAPLMFGVARVVLPSAAVLIGVAVALHPSLVMLSAADLLKDPSIVCGMALVIWALVRLTREGSSIAMVAFFLAGIVGALYLRTGRFYAFAYLEAAFIVTMAVMVVARMPVFRRTLALVLTVSMFVIAEAIPARMSWPPAPIMVVDTVSYALGAPGLSHYALGFFDYVQLSEARRSGEALPPALARGQGVVGLAVTSSANLFRRLYGPFVWILPPDWRFQALQAGDYLLYPGMLLWYGLIPFFVIGIAATGWGLITRTERRFGVVFLWLFTAVYFAQYLAINLSYRQRDVMLPVLLFFACLGAMWATRVPGWRRWYVGYWLALVLLAQAHLLARAWVIR